MNGNKIEVELIAKANEQSIAQAGKKIAAGVEKQQGSTAPAAQAGGQVKKTALDWVSEQNAIKRAGGVWNGSKWMPAPTAGGAAAGAGEAGGAGGIGAAGAAGAVLAVAAAFYVFLKAAEKVTAIMRKASDEAARLYAKALQGGGGLGFHTASDAFASALGVSEQDVFKYGDAIKYLNERMGESISIMAKTAPNLATVSWEFAAIRYQAKAMAALFANELAGTLRTLLNSLNQIGRVMMPFIKALGMLIDAVIRGHIAFKLLALIGKDGGAAGSPASNTKRLAGSAWERMGFVVGRGGADHAAKTAANTKRIAHLMEQLVNKLPHMAHEGRTYGSAQKP